MNYPNFTDDPWFPKPYGPLKELYEHEGIDPDDHETAIKFLLKILEPDMTQQEKDNFRYMQDETHADEPLKTQRYLETLIKATHEQNIRKAGQKQYKDILKKDLEHKK